MPTRGARLGRLLLFLAAWGGAGDGLLAWTSGEGAVLKRVPEGVTSEPLPEHGVPRLKVLVEAAEKALESEDLQRSEGFADEAEALLADWPSEVLNRADVGALVERLRAVKREVDLLSKEEESLKVDTEIVGLSSAEAAAERSQVLAAEQGAHFDFPIDLNDKVLAWVKAFTTERKGFIEASLSRATAYLPMVRQVFAEEGIPQDLAYLGIIESGYKNTAFSRAKAAGMWQFIRSTGRIYGLNGNAWVEERRDPVKSTRAAARYLRRLYEISGDWYTALAGYNAGPLTPERAAQALGSRNYWDMHRSRYLRNETKHYVPELCAVILIGKSPERYGLNVVQAPPFVFETVEVDRQTSLSVLARVADCDSQALKDLNPQLLRGITPPGSYTLRVPPGTGQATQKALARIPGSERVEFKTYVVRAKDTLVGLSARFKVSPEDLLAFNDLSKAQIKAGRRIKVPPPAMGPVDAQDLRSAQQRAATKADQPLEPLPGIPLTDSSQFLTASAGERSPADRTEGTSRESGVPAVKAASENRAQRGAEAELRPAKHVVKPGETLFSIALRYGLDVANLRQWNKVKGNRIQAGQHLRLQKR